MHEEEKTNSRTKNNLIKAFSTNKMNISYNNFNKSIKGNFKQRLIKTNKTNFNSIVNMAYINNSSIKINTNLENSNDIYKLDNPLFSPKKIKKHYKRNSDILKSPKLNIQTDLIKKFIFFAKKGDKENFLNIIEQLFNEDINLNYIDENGFSALHYAVDEGNFKICEILIKTKKININIKSKIDNKTPLHISCKNGYFDITKLLILNNADLNCLDNEKNNPLYYCVQGNYYEVAKMILSQNSDYNLIYYENIYGESPLSLAIKSNEKIGSLLKEYESLLLKKKKSTNNFNNNNTNNNTNNNNNNKKFSTRNKNLFNKNEKNIKVNNNHSKGVLYNNSNYLTTCHKKLNSYISKNNINNSNNCSKYSNQNTSTLCDSSNNSIKKTNHIYSISTLPKEIITKKKNNIQNGGYIIINKNGKEKELSQNFSFKGITNFKTSTTTNTIVTLNSNTNNSIMKSSISSSNKDSDILEDKIHNKKNLYKKCFNPKINKSNILNKNSMKNTNKIIAAKKIMKREDAKRIIIELNESDIKNNKIQKIEIDLIDEPIKTIAKSRNNLTKKS